MHWPERSPPRSAALLAMILLALATASHWAVAQSASLRLTIDYGDGASKTIADLPWSKGSTVLDVMNAATARPHGITFRYGGSAGFSFMIQIDDLPNQGGGAGKKNWQLWVNSTYANRSFGVYEVQSSDVVLWRFTTQEGK
jgi:Domain of unknown function (DUF4430)